MKSDVVIVKLERDRGRSSLTATTATRTIPREEFERHGAEIMADLGAELDRAELQCSLREAQDSAARMRAHADLHHTLRLECTPDSPMPRGAPGRWSHAGAHETRDDGDTRRMECRDCGHAWTEELPQ